LISFTRGQPSPPCHSPFNTRRELDLGHPSPRKLNLNLAAPPAGFPLSDLHLASRISPEAETPSSWPSRIPISCSLSHHFSL
jgi:hypothetical protein